MRGIEVNAQYKLTKTRNLNALLRVFILQTCNSYQLSNTTLQFDMIEFKFKFKLAVTLITENVQESHERNSYAFYSAGCSLSVERLSVGENLSNNFRG